MDLLSSPLFKNIKDSCDGARSSNQGFEDKHAINFALGRELVVVENREHRFWVPEESKVIYRRTGENVKHCVYHTKSRSHDGYECYLGANFYTFVGGHWCVYRKALGLEVGGGTVSNKARYFPEQLPKVLARGFLPSQKSELGLYHGVVTKVHHFYELVARELLHLRVCHCCWMVNSKNIFRACLSTSTTSLLFCYQRLFSCVFYFSRCSPLPSVLAALFRSALHTLAYGSARR
mmetsp:Transcript_14463/g.25914  ORF Transcript_14463/g.25914 Transcript_14463/m.25914 type:complete len:234 (-) Transcript_14463:10-711(-)